MKDPLNLFVEKKQEFLGFLKTRFSLYHESNVFFRDLHYGVMAFLKMNGLPVRYSSSEELTRRVILSYEDSKTFFRIDERTWMLNYTQFKKMPAKPIPAAKPPAKPAQPVAASASKPTSQQAASEAVGVQRGVSA